MPRRNNTMTIAQSRRADRDEQDRRAHYAAKDEARVARHEAATSVYDIGFREAKLTEDFRVISLHGPEFLLEMGQCVQVVCTATGFLAFLPAEGTREAKCIELKASQIQWVN